MVKHEQKFPKSTLTSADVYEAQKLKRIAGRGHKVLTHSQLEAIDAKNKLLSPADLVTHAAADAIHQMPKMKKQGEKDKEDEKLAMEVKGVKDAEKAEKKPRKPRAKKEKAEPKEEVLSFNAEKEKVVDEAEQKAQKAIRKGRFAKGSEEAKAHMARIREMRKKKEAK